MKKIIFILSILIFSNNLNLKAQGLLPGECGIMFTYDATGSLTQRQFICNNSGSTMYRTTGDNKNKADSINLDIEKSEAKEKIIKVNAITPNPTTGRFTVTLSSPLQNANVVLVDINGRAIENKKQSGSTLDFDISARPSGIYFVRIENEGKVVTFKVVKQ